MPQHRRPKAWPVWATPFKPVGFPTRWHLVTDSRWRALCSTSECNPQFYMSKVSFGVMCDGCILSWKAYSYEWVLSGGHGLKPV